MPCQFIDAAQESTAAQLCPSSLKSSLLVHPGYMGHIYDLKSTSAYHIALPCKASSLFAHSACAQNQSAFVLDISATFFQCTMPMQCWSMNPKLRFSEQTCLVVLSLFFCTLQAWGFQPGCATPLCHCITSSSCSGMREALAAVLTFLLTLGVTETTSDCLALAVLLMLDSITSVAH